VREQPLDRGDRAVTTPGHSLRHAFGTECAARGVPVPVIKDLMGHASIATTMRYVTVTNGQLDAAIRQALGDRWATALRRPKTRNPWREQLLQGYQVVKRQ
jgi:integrase